MKLTKNQKWILGGALVLGAIILYRRNQRNNEKTSSARGGSFCDCSKLNPKNTMQGNCGSGDCYACCGEARPLSNA